MNRAQRRASHANGVALTRKGFDRFEEVNLLEAARLGLHLPKNMIRAWKNSMYIVMEYTPSKGEWGTIQRVAIRRADSQPSRSWADLQRIKNEIFGPERTAIEVFPPVSELTDVANIYWLWLLPLGTQLPFFFSGLARPFHTFNQQEGG